MCGFAGAIGVVNQAVERGIALASEAQKLRGPDDHGTWRRADESDLGVLLDHRRLSIIDLSPAGRQPMVDSISSNALCFNGEIYNYRTLRRELEDTGVRFKSETDTEVILKGYEIWGEGVLDRLRGMFAFALWDDARRQILLARDRLGIKPLYVANLKHFSTQPLIIFASELRALLASGLVERKARRNAVATLIWNGFVFGSESIIENVEILEAGCAIWIGVDAKLPRAQRYWTFPRARPGTYTPADLKCVLEEAVRLRLISDVPLGIFLSGGVDSSAVAAIASREASNIRTFTVGFKESDYDESAVARSVAQKIGSTHTEIRLDESSFVKDLDFALGSLDQPTFDGVNSFFVSRAVRQAGIKVALAGVGGDEIFGGYSSFKHLPRLSSLLRVCPTNAARFFAKFAVRYLKRKGGGFPAQIGPGKLLDVVRAGESILNIYQVARALFTRDFLYDLGFSESILQRWYGIGDDWHHDLTKLVQGEPPLHAISLLELRAFVGERLLRDIDCTSMSVSLEVRVPLIDHEVIEVAAGMREKDRFHPVGLKRAIRTAALTELPDKMFDRPKKGFELPFDRWCRGELSERIESTLLDRERCKDSGLHPDAVAKLWNAYKANVPGLYWSRVWLLFIWLDWLERHRVSLD